MKGILRTQQTKDEYKEEHGYNPFQFEHNTNNRNYSNEILGMGF